MMRTAAERDAHVRQILAHLETTNITAQHAEWWLCRLETHGMPPAEGVGGSSSDAAAMAGNIRWRMGHIYIQPWGQA